MMLHGNDARFAMIFFKRPDIDCYFLDAMLPPCHFDAVSLSMLPPLFAAALLFATPLRFDAVAFAMPFAAFARQPPLRYCCRRAAPPLMLPLSSLSLRRFSMLPCRYINRLQYTTQHCRSGCHDYAMPLRAAFSGYMPWPAADASASAACAMLPPPLDTRMLICRHTPCHDTFCCHFVDY